MTEKHVRTVVKATNSLIVTLPKKITDKLNIDAGDYLLFELVGDKIEVRKV